MIYCKPDRDERTRINRALDRWGAFEFFMDKVLILQKDDTKKAMVCLANNKIEELMADMVDPYSLGLVIGELRKQFIPSIAGADLFARYSKRNKFYIVVNENAEKLVLYGRDIMGESIVEASSTLTENELVILLNTSFEAIAIGRTRFSGNLLLQKGRVTVTTLADAGYYLREEG
ncbi:MAG TPA: PUA domain-containing protein [Nitrososphaera sp.]|nr:PUA domain-containing protein [Nitrososphaera sp.]HEX2170423.1 PUA domain-containing protein [Nitrososphaera sp.]